MDIVMEVYVALKSIYTPVSIKVVIPDVQAANSKPLMHPSIPSEMQAFQVSTDSKWNGPSLL